MAADRSAPLAAAAQRKREQATARARSALRELDQRGESVTFQNVARRAGVSRQWLYQQPNLRAEIERLRAAAHQRPDGLPARSERRRDRSGSGWPRSARGTASCARRTARSRPN